LRKRLQSEDDRLVETMGSRRIKFVERGGRTLESLLCRTNPWKERHCGREGCVICRSGKGGQCRTESVVYEVKCGQCEREGRGRKVYIGETGKSGYERMVQHWRSWRAKESDSFLWKHDSNVHGGRMEESQLVARIISKPKKALQRQIEEAVRILEEEPQALLNSKSGYGVNKIPRISVIMG
jgi:hypothetical protein